MNFVTRQLALISGPALPVVRWVIGGSFLIAGVIKVARPGEFFTHLSAYEVAFPDPLLRLIAVIFPWVEVICGAALLANLWAETIRGLATALGFIFILMLGQAVIRGLDVNCGCFGPGEAGWQDRPLGALARAIAFFLGAGWLWLRTLAPPAVSSPAVDGGAAPSAGRAPLR